MYRHHGERIHTNRLFQPTHSVIDIQKGPIDYVHFYVCGWCGAFYRFHTYNWKAEYAIPDPHLERGFPKIALRTKKVWKPPSHLEWKGRDRGLGIVQYLNEDLSTRHIRCKDIELRADPKYRRWFLIPTRHPINPMDVSPSKEEWSYYEFIAEYLLRVSASFKETRA